MKNNLMKFFLCKKNAILWIQLYIFQIVTDNDEESQSDVRFRSNDERNLLNQLIKIFEGKLMERLIVKVLFRNSC